MDYATQWCIGCFILIITTGFSIFDTDMSDFFRQSSFGISIVLFVDILAKIL